MRRSPLGEPRASRRDGESQRHRARAGHGEKQLRLTASTSVAPADGKLLWEHPWPGGGTRIVQPAMTADGDVLLVRNAQEMVAFRLSLADLYHDRWEEETVLDEIKAHLCDCATVNRPVVFRSKTPDRVVQELWGMLIAYNATRKTVHEAARRKELDPRRVSFTASLERTREATPCGLKSLALGLGQLEEGLHGTEFWIPSRTGTVSRRNSKRELSAPQLNHRELPWAE